MLANILTNNVRGIQTGVPPCGPVGAHDLGVQVRSAQHQGKLRMEVVHVG